MTADAPILDLLRERRRALGLVSMSSLLRSRSLLLRRGILIGALLLGTAAGLTLLIWLRHQLVKAQMAELNQYEAQATDLRNQLSSRKASVDALMEGNRRVAQKLADARTSSALLADLQLRTPDGVQLQSAEVRGAALVVRGRALDPMAFARINAMQLELNRSPLISPDSMTLSKVERQVAAASGAGEKQPMQPVQFDLSGSFGQMPVSRQLAVLQQLGSQGMARRLAMLQSEGLTP
ncbi:MAG: PilN domain-containing protein [Synechococcaceae cyanobacterium]|nr:PilN domain-containing protein [Synechococcaceae cyanobacterium]